MPLKLGQWTVKRDEFSAIAALLIGLTIALGLMDYATGGRVAYTMDSLMYRDVAVNFLAGHPMQSTNVLSMQPELQPLLNWPPAYPFLWAAVANSGPLNIDEVPIYLNRLLLGLNTLIMFWVCWMVTGRASISVSVAIVNAFVPSTMVVYGHAWSETLFIPLVLLTYALFWQYKNTGGKLAWLALAAVVLGLANWTRYSGVVFIALLLLSVFAESGFTWKKRIMDASFAMLLVASVIAPLWLHNLQLSGALSGSSRGGVPLNSRWSDDIGILFNLFEHSFFAFGMVLRANLEIPILMVLTYIAIKKFFRSGSQRRLAPEIWMPFFWMTGYLLFLLYARSIQKNIDLDLRMVAVAFPFLLLTLVPLANGAFSNRKFSIEKVIVTLLLGLLVNSGLQEAFKTHENYAVIDTPRWRADFGLGYRDLSNTSPSSSAIKEALKHVEPSTIILTDYRALYIQYLTGLKTYSPYDNNCSRWVITQPNVLLMIGAAEQPAWMVDCQREHPDWKILKTSGRAAPSMYVD